MNIKISNIDVAVSTQFWQDDAMSINSEQTNLRIKSKLYYYAADVIDVYDGDTITVNLNLGLGIWQHGIRIRFWKVSAPEVRGAEREQGLIVRDKVRDLILNKSILLRTILDKRGADQTGKYGRLLGEVLVENERGALINVNDLLLGLGLALPMGADGSKTRTVPMAGARAGSDSIPPFVECPFCGEERQVVQQDESVAVPHASDASFTTETKHGEATESTPHNRQHAIVYLVVQCPNCLDEARPLVEFADQL